MDIFFEITIPETLSICIGLIFFMVFILSDGIVRQLYKKRYGRIRLAEIKLIKKLKVTDFLLIFIGSLVVIIFFNFYAHERTGINFYSIFLSTVGYFAYPIGMGLWKLLLWSIPAKST